MALGAAQFERCPARQAWFHGRVRWRSGLISLPISRVHGIIVHRFLFDRKHGRPASIVGVVPNRITSGGSWYRRWVTTARRTDCQGCPQRSKKREVHAQHILCVYTVCIFCFKMKKKLRKLVVVESYTWRVKRSRTKNKELFSWL